MKKHIIKQSEFHGLVSRICRNLHYSHWKPDYVVGITRGGLVPAVMISHWLDVPLQSLNISLRDNSEVGPESNLWMAEEAFGYDGKIETRFNPELAKNILIVDDINDTGATINWLMQDWKSGCLPDNERWNNVFNHNVKFAVVVDNLASKCEVKMDYSGLEINKSEEDVWVEFPYEEWWTK